MTSRRDQDERNRVIGDFVARLLPVVLSLVAASVLARSIGFDSPIIAWAVFAVLGFAVGQWLDMRRTLDRLTRVEDRLRSEAFDIRRLNGAESVEHAVKSLYHTPGAKIFATHINYRDADLSDDDPRLEDWASHLYTGLADGQRSTNTVFRRIVSARTTQDREWIRNMVQKSTNRHYRIKVLEVDPNQLPYPNIVIIEERSGALRAFVSFRGATAAGDGRFAFVTSSRPFVAGLRDHFDEFFDDLPAAETCIERWDAEELVQAGTGSQTLLLGGDPASHDAEGETKNVEE